MARTDDPNLATTPIALTGLPYRDQPYPVEPNAAGALVAGRVFEGIGDLAFRPITLHIGVVPRVAPVDYTAGQGGSDPAPVAPVGGVVVGDVSVEIRGLLPTGVYLRRLTLAPWRMLCLDISTWSDCYLGILRATTTNCRLLAIVSNRPATTTIREPLIYAEQYGAAGEYLPPPGADRLFTDTADAGFLWRTTPQTGVVIDVPEAITAGPEFLIKGTHIVTTVANWRAVWRITL